MTPPRPHKAIARITPDEYLALEEKSLAKHEYLDGVIYDWSGEGAQGRAGTGSAHNIVSQNLTFLLRSHLRGGPCQVYMADLKLHVKAAGAYFYPDVMVTCSDADRHSDRVKSEPLLVVEVLSASTEAFDRGEKLLHYRAIPTLREYLLADPERINLELYRRAGSGEWTLHLYGPGAAVALQSVDLAFPIEAVYQDVDL